MSTEALALRVIELAVVALAAILAARSARAAEVVFRPALSFGLYHDGNVNVVNYDPKTQAETTERGDDLAGVALELGVDRSTANSTLSFSYRPAYRKYKSASDLDYLENAVLLSYARDTSSGNRTNVEFDALRSESQGIRSFTADRPVTLVPRTTFTRVQASAGGTVAATQRSFVDWGVRGGVNRYDAVAGVTFQDDSHASANGAWRYALSERGSLGVGLDLGRIGYQAVSTSGSVPTASLSDVATQDLSLVGTQAVGRATELEYSGGATRSTSAGQSFTHGSFHLMVDRRFAELSELRAGVGRGVSPGTGFGGASVDTGGWVAYTRNPPRRGWSGSVNGGYWFRESIDPAAAQNGHATTLNLSGSFGWSFNAYLALNAFYAYMDQGATGASSSALGTRYASYGLFLRWALRGR